MFEDILGGFVTLFSDDYAIWFVVLAAFVGIVFGALPGLTAAAAIAKKAYQAGRPIIDVAEEETDLGRDELERLLDPASLTRGGIPE